MFLLYNEVNQPHVYTYPLPLKCPSHPNSHPTPLGHHRPPSWAPCLYSRSPLKMHVNLRLSERVKDTRSTLKLSPDFLFSLPSLGSASGWWDSGVWLCEHPELPVTAEHRQCGPAQWGGELEAMWCLASDPGTAGTGAVAGGGPAALRGLLLTHSPSRTGPLHWLFPLPRMLIPLISGRHPAKKQLAGVGALPEVRPSFPHWHLHPVCT